MWHVYVVRARDGSLYTGIATDVERRMAEHRGGGSRGARYLRGRAPFRLTFQRPIGSRALALKVEQRIKRLPRREKERLLRINPGSGRLLDLLAVAVPDRR